MKRNIFTHIALGLVIALSSAASQADSALSKKDAKELAQYREAERIGNEHLVKFDTLDFAVYSNQKWDRFKESHAANI
ncbi:MAG: polyketide cyclase, partial [Acinetobacter sp.]